MSLMTTQVSHPIGMIQIVHRLQGTLYYMLECVSVPCSITLHTYNLPIPSLCQGSQQTLTPNVTLVAGLVLVALLSIPASFHAMGIVLHLCMHGCNCEAPILAVQGSR